MKFLPSYSKSSRSALLKLLAQKSYRYGDFTLSSGVKSNHYVNCKPISLSGMGISLLSVGLLEQVEDEAVSVAGLTLGADPLVSGVSLAAELSGRELNSLIVRKEPKGHGTGQWLEGPLPPKGAVVTVLEDVVTSGGSSLKAVEQLRLAGYKITRVVTIVDRQEGGADAMSQKGIDLISLFLLDEIIQQFNFLN